MELTLILKFLFRSKKTLSSTDAKFNDIDFQKFRKEFIILQFELFALAWLHQFNDIELAIKQSVFTKEYLKEKKYTDIWRGMGTYNQAIARSIMIEKVFREKSERRIGRVIQERRNRAYFAFVDKIKIDLFDKFIETGFDPECIARVLNRLFSEEVWKKSITAGLLLFTFCNRLGFEKSFEPSTETHREWFIVVNEFYRKFRESLNKIKIKTKK